MITLGPGVSNPPPSLTSNVPEQAIADVAHLVPASQFNGVLAGTLAAQGYTAGNNWVYSLSSPPNPPGLTNPQPMNTVPPVNTRFHITAYNLYLNPAMSAFGELFDFTLVNPPADPVVPGATVTRHWLQLLNEDRQYNNFGFPLAGQPGFWKMDNGSTVGTNGGSNRGAVNGAGMYYDSNSTGGFSVPPNFHDSPEFFSGVGSYFHATTIPAWDVNLLGTNYTIVGDTGIAWGFAIVPEPASMTLLIFTAVPTVVAWRRRAKVNTSESV
jgi:hypothetical protein